ncbi:MAG TPA: hypothetical protein HA224_02520 [Nanoarchaeota archaeon]|nr:hypothetical protein [Nanoarchaeota archaeon]
MKKPYKFIPPTAGRIEVPYGVRQVATFIYPFKGPGTYNGVGQEVLAGGELVPTGDLTAVLLEAACCVPKFKKAPEFVEVRQIMRDSWFWAFQANLWTPNGVYVRHDSKAEGLELEMDVRTLDKMLKNGTEVNGVRFSKDETVRFAPKSTYELGLHTPKSLANDGFMVASYGVKGAKRMARVAGTFDYGIRTFGRDTQAGQPPVKGLSAVGDYGGGLDFFGDVGNYLDGFASRVLKSAPQVRKIQ